MYQLLYLIKLILHVNGCQRLMLFSCILNFPRLTLFHSNLKTTAQYMLALLLASFHNTDWLSPEQFIIDCHSKFIGLCDGGQSARLPNEKSRNQWPSVHVQWYEWRAAPNRFWSSRKMAESNFLIRAATECFSSTQVLLLLP